MRWVIQVNLGNREEIARLLASCRELECPVVELNHVPFSTEAPEVDAEVPTVFYGATGFVSTVARLGKWSPGVFFDPERFDFSTYLPLLGARLLNSEAEVSTLSSFVKRPLPDEHQIFLRPRGDTKEFAGRVVTMSELRRWVRGLQAEETCLSPDCAVVAAEPVGLSAEWRTFIVDGQVVAGSRYRRYHELDISAELPPEVVDFAEETASLYSPAQAFVLDIARSGPGLYVIEYNCLNSSGFYAADTTALVRAIAESW